MKRKKHNHHMIGQKSRCMDGTHTRKEGIQQETEGVLDLTHPAISTALATKDVVIGSAKIISPRKIRKSKPLKKMRIV